MSESQISIEFNGKVKNFLTITIKFNVFKNHITSNEYVTETSHFWITTRFME